MKINEYILLNNLGYPVYKTLDLLDLANTIICLNNERIIKNSDISYEKHIRFDYNLVIEKVDIRDVGVNNEL